MVRGSPRLKKLLLRPFSGGDSTTGLDVAAPAGPGVMGESGAEGATGTAVLVRFGGDGANALVTLEPLRRAESPSC